MTKEYEFEPALGAVAGAGGVNFLVWAPQSRDVELLLGERVVPLAQRGDGYFHALVEDAAVGELYRYRLDGSQVLPDPASRFQPEGVHGPSQIIDPSSFRWRNDSPEFPLADSVIYELHVGTFTEGGTFEAARNKLPYLAELGVNTVELMPLADFPGRRNWGYDPAAFFAPARAYGRPNDLRSLVDEAHGLGLRVVLDVVYNHFGPDGSYLPAYSPGVLTERHHTPWGQALDFDGPNSSGVRRFCIENALMWLREYRFDGLRLDATFAIVDDGPRHVLAQLAAAVERLPGPSRTLIAEDPRNLRNLVLSEEQGGLNLDAVWADDLHHQIRTRLTGEERGYFRDFGGSSEQIARTLLSNWYFSGHHSLHHGGPRGTPAADLAPAHFVYCIQNHDQVGNRPQGDRLNHVVSAEEYRAATALLLFAPQLPMLFMGQEWAASTPFQYFTDHQGDLGKMVSEGREREFVDFAGEGDLPDPQDPETFSRSRLDWAELERPPHEGTRALYRDLLRLRRRLRGGIAVEEVRRGGLLLRRAGHLLAVAFDPGTEFELPAGVQQLWSSEDLSYSNDPLPPLLDGGRVRFSRAGALLLDQRSQR